MKRLRRIVCLLGTICWLVTGIAPTPAQAVEVDPALFYYPVDIESHWAYEQLTDFVSADVIRGFVNSDAQGNTYVEVRPDASISRAEFVTLLVRALGLTSNAPARTFADVPAGQWYSEPVRIASSLGIVGGVSSTQFAPTRIIRRDEIAAMVVRAFEATIPFSGSAKTFTDVPRAYWATPYIDKASRAGIINGYQGLFHPGTLAKRGEAVTMLYNALHQENTHLPDDRTLTNLVLSSERDNSDALNNRQMERLAELNRIYSSGSYQEMVDIYLARLEQEWAKGVTTTITPQNLSAQVTQKNDRYAVVKLSGSYEVTVQDNDSYHRDQVPGDSLFYLKKMPGEERWAIYRATKTPQVPSGS